MTSFCTNECRIAEDGYNIAACVEKILQKFSVKFCDKTNHSWFLAARFLCHLESAADYVAVRSLCAAVVDRPAGRRQQQVCAAGACDPPQHIEPQRAAADVDDVSAQQGARWHRLAVLRFHVTKHRPTRLTLTDHPPQVPITFGDPGWHRTRMPMAYRVSCCLIMSHI